MTWGTRVAHFGSREASTRFFKSQVTPRTHDIARLCQRYGGGGHPVVGAVTLPPGQPDEARRIGAEIAAALQTEATT